jgi:two-component system, LytTR family, response regulator LytT
MRIVIIEDEALTAKDLEQTILQVKPSATIVAKLSTVEEGINFLNNNSAVDLIFSDIELGDGQSFTIFETCQTTIPIIFCTAYNDYALEAFNTAGIFYILKPFSTNTINLALQKYQLLKNNVPTAINYTEIINTIKQQIVPQKLPNIIVHIGERIVPIAAEKIALFSIENSIIKAYLFDKQIAIVDQTLDDLEKKFIPLFFRANRQYLVNRSAVKEASHHFNRKLLIQLTFEFKDQILVGKEKVTPFLDWLTNY